METNRRSFLGGLAATAIDPSAPMLPTVPIGKFKVTRLVAGYNPVGGYSHSTAKLSAVMKDWFTPQRTLEYALACERNGINTWQASDDAKVFDVLRKAWDRGSKLQWICLVPDLSPEKWKEIVALKPIAVVHHGERTDKLYRTGEQVQIRDFLKKAHDFGLLAGVSSHSPTNIARTEDAGWEQDLYMTCFYDIRRDESKVQAKLGDLPVDELYLRGDPDRMTKVIREVKRPCLGFKILAAGRMCNNRATIEKAFQYAYANIKPSDGVIVGMFPILTDEIAEDTAFARKYAV